MMRGPRSRRPFDLGLAAVLLIVTVCAVAGWLRRDSTIYAPGYSWSKFSSIRMGMTPGEVTRILGQPLNIEQCGGEIHWGYHGASSAPSFAAVGGPISSLGSVQANFVADLSGKVIGAHHAGMGSAAEELVGESLDEVRKRYGPPPTEYTIPRQTMYWYSELRNIKGEYVMLIHFDASGKVYQIDADRIGHYLATPGSLPRPSGFLEWLEWYVL